MFPIKTVEYSEAASSGYGACTEITRIYYARLFIAATKVCGTPPWRQQKETRLRTKTRGTKSLSLVGQPHTTSHACIDRRAISSPLQRVAVFPLHFRALFRARRSTNCAGNWQIDALLFRQTNDAHRRLFTLHGRRQRNGTERASGDIYHWSEFIYFTSRGFAPARSFSTGKPLAVVPTLGADNIRLIRFLRSVSVSLFRCRVLRLFHALYLRPVVAQRCGALLVGSPN